MTKAKKINAVAKRNPAIIFFLSATLQAELPVCEVGGADLIWEDRNFCYGA